MGESIAGLTWRETCLGTSLQSAARRRDLQQNGAPVGTGWTLLIMEYSSWRL
ncbi:MAG: hypothetical protein ACXWVA_05705 [Rhodoplanes sp.]